MKPLPQVIHAVPVSGSFGEAVMVTCRSQTICTLQESAVNLTCSYPKTFKPQLSFWCSSKQKAKWRNQESPEDLALDSDYAGRVRYSTSSDSSTLTVSDLRVRDSGEYQLMLITETGEEHLSAAIALTVSGKPAQPRHQKHQQMLFYPTTEENRHSYIFKNV